jgi:hypothetical protein
MNFFRQYRTAWFFAALLVACCGMVLRQVDANHARHTELRESLILLHSRGYKPEADHLFQRLILDLDRLPDRVLVEDFQRTLTLVDPGGRQPENPVWKYHWTVSNELDKRRESSLQRALKLAH